MFEVFSDWQNLPVIGTFAGVLVSHVYFSHKGLSVASVLSLSAGSKLTVNSRWYMTCFAIITNVLLSHLLVMVFYQAETAQQYAFASLSVVAMLSGHMSFSDFKKAASGG